MDAFISKLTAGSWIAKKLATHTDPGYVVLWPDKGGQHMRRLDYQGHFTQADATLIAASRELLEVCQEIEAHCRNTTGLQGSVHSEEGKKLREKLRAAIAKATPA